VKRRHYLFGAVRVCENWVRKRGRRGIIRDSPCRGTNPVDRGPLEEGGVVNDRLGLDEERHNKTFSEILVGAWWEKRERSK